MPDDWKLRLVPASYGGAGFKVDVTARGGGRRTALHEFPKRDDPYAEDMGRRAKRFTISGYVIGDDYFDQRDLLIEALETEGSGLLIHPTMGEFQVNPVDFTVNERRERGRIAEFEMTFVESGDAGGTAITNDTQSGVDSAAAQSDAQAGSTADATLGGSQPTQSGVWGGGVGGINAGAGSGDLALSPNGGVGHA